MNIKEFTQSLKLGYKFYEDLGESSNCGRLSTLPASREFNELALDTSVPYPEVFFHGLSLQQFNFLLKDYSYFQFSFISDNEIRYAFYPSPFGFKEIVQVREIIQDYEEGLYDSEALSAFIQDIEINYTRPLIRYEYSISQYKPGIHPASHFHIGTFGEDRWIIHRKLTPLAFCLQIGKLYYAHHWETLTISTAKGERISNEFDSLLFGEKKKCICTDEDKFTEFEKNAFYFS